MFQKILNFFIILCIITQITVSVDQKDYEIREKSLSRQKRLLLFPTSTVWQLSMCVVSQVSKITSHKFAVNAGFQINYNLPYNLSNFYKPSYFKINARSVFNLPSPIVSFINKLVESNDNFGFDSSGKIAPTEYPLSENNEQTESRKNDDENGTTENLESLNDNEETTTKRQSIRNSNERKSKVKRDVTAAEFYSGIKDTMKIAGYHDDCLLKSICELAKHPLNNKHHDLLDDILHFALTPSVHQAFDSETENYEKGIYEEAEETGKSGGDCDLAYGNCESSPLHSISNYITEEIYD